MTNTTRTDTHTHTPHSHLDAASADHADPDPNSDPDQDRADPDERELFRGFMANWPTGVTVLTTQVDAQPLGCTAQSLMSLSLDPPQLLVSLAETSNTLAGLRRTGVFGLSILSAGQAELGRRFATGSARQRFSGTPVETVHGVPILAGAAAAMVCRLAETWQRADHVLVVGLPLWQVADRAAEGVLLRHRGQYRALS